LAAVVGGAHMIATMNNTGNDKVLGLSLFQFKGSQLVQPVVGAVLVGCGLMCLRDMY
jgi:hypothetical protein